MLLSIITFLLNFSLYSVKSEGQIFFEKDTLNVTFEIPYSTVAGRPEYEKLQYKVKYFDANGKKVVLRPNQAKEIRFTYNSQKVRMISKENSFGGGSPFRNNDFIFLKLEMNGKLKLFKYYGTYTTPGSFAGGVYMPGSVHNAEEFLFEKEEGNLMQPGTFSFKSDLMEYFSDCIDLVKKIENKEFKKDDIHLIVRFYNNSCK